mmetsp:Transcript_18457/g.19079  ORF Transcript_18457/g.19079 Transcript_18457/m.19079 type:complete len:196 (+) Transcript_18457:3-590(+)
MNKETQEIESTNTSEVTNNDQEILHINEKPHKTIEKEKYPSKSLLDETLSQLSLEQIQQGFTINHLKMKDGDNGKVLWQTNKFDLEDGEKSEDLPKEILKCKVVVRELNFSSKEKIYDLELVQNFYLLGELIETARFYFGFVIPDSTNNWEQVVEAKAEDEMLSPEILSGNLVVEIMFLTKGELIVRNRIVINYV